MKPLLTDADFERAARRLKCGVAAIKAVAEVESRGQGFYKDGFPVILFERHKFREFTQGRYNRSHPHLSGPAGNYGAAGQNQRNKFNQAFGLNPIAAMKSCSWGKFQIMGFNYKDCGFNDVGQFVDAMKESEGRQLDAFVAFVIANRLDDELRNLEWAKFARGYNGPTYKKNNYDTKMARAYAKYVKTSAAPQTLSETPANTPSVITDNTPPDGTLPNTQIADQIINTGDAAPPAPPPEEVTITAPEKDGATATSTKMVIAGITVPPIIAGVLKSISDAVSQGYVNAAEIGTFLLNFLQNNIKWVLALAGLLIVLQIVKKIIKGVTFLITVLTAAIPHWNTVNVVPAEVEKKPWWRIW